MFLTIIEILFQGKAVNLNKYIDVCGHASNNMNVITYIMCWIKHDRELLLCVQSILNKF